MRGYILRRFTVKTKFIICLFIALHLYCVGCEFYVAPEPTRTPVVVTHPAPVPVYDMCHPAHYEPLYFDYCAEYDPYYGCTCVVFIDDYDWECRVEYCYYWDTCQWEFFDAYCIY